MVKTLSKPDINTTHILESEEPVLLLDKSQDDNYKEVNVVLVPENVTPLGEYEKELLKAGLSKKHVKEIIEGLADSPLYESSATK